MPTYNPTSVVQYKPTNVLTVIKNPFAILGSWYKYMSMNGKNIKGSGDSFGAFLRSPIYFFDEWSDSVSPQYYFSNPIQMWNSVVWNHLSFVEEMNGLVIKYEDLLRSPEQQCNIISKKFNLIKSTEDLQVPTKRVNNMGDSHNPKSRNYVTEKSFNKSDFFLNQQFMDDYTQEDINFVVSELNDRLIIKTGYKVT